MSKIEKFLVKLRNYEDSHIVFNPYRNKSVLSNLRTYLQFMKKHDGRKVLLVGEAPGYKGCRITGIPFTSSHQLTNSNNVLLQEFRDKLVFSEIDSENTAKIVWDFLDQRKTIPLFWNSFPFHPHHAENCLSNRPPTSTEIDLGVTFLRELYDIFMPETVASLGRKGERAIHKAFPSMPVKYIRHPSYGGKTDFISGMQKII